MCLDYHKKYGGRKIDRKELEAVVEKSPVAAFILEFLSGKDAPVDYSEVLNAGHEKGYHGITVGIATGQLLILDWVGEEICCGGQRCNIFIKNRNGEGESQLES